MTRTLRGAWSRRRTLLPLLLLTTVVVAGVVTVLGFAEQAGTSRLLCLPLLVLGAVAVPSTGQQLAAARRGEIALARLRGLTGAELVRLLAAEPLVVLLAGGLLGLVAGVAGSWLAVAGWTDVTASLPGPRVLVAGLGIVAAGLAGVLAGVVSAVREPLSGQVALAVRARPATTLGVFLEVLVVVAAGVAVQRAGARGADPDWVVLAGPALVGLAVAQVAVWTVRLLARAALGPTSLRPLPGYLAVRRLARSAEGAGALRLVVAAGVVAGLALTGSVQVDDWAEESTRVRAGAPLRVPLDEDAPGALALTRRLDPQGRWLMAAVLVPGQGSLPARRAFVDTERYDRVVGDFLADTAAAGAARRIGSLGGGVVASRSRPFLEVTVRGVSRRLRGSLNPRVTLTYRDQHGRTSPRTVRLSLPRSGRATTARARLRDCSGGCTATALRLETTPGDAPLPWVLTGLELDGVDLLARGWRPAAQLLPAGVVPIEIVRVDDGLLAPESPAPLDAYPSGRGPRLPVLATDSVTWAGEPQEVDSPGGDERPAEVVDRVAALPLVEADGLLADLSRAAAGAPPTVPAAQTMVLARADTPAAILAALSREAGHPPVTLSALVAEARAATGAVQARVYALIAGLCLAVALLVLATAAARDRAAWLREAASLRAVGVSLVLLGRSARAEVMVLSLVAALATYAGGLGAVTVLLPHLPLVTVPPHAVPLSDDVARWPLLAVAAGTALLVALVAGRARTVGGDRGRPADLREDGVP